jgi:hypothetical protein
VVLAAYFRQDDSDVRIGLSRTADGSAQSHGAAQMGIYGHLMGHHQHRHARHRNGLGHGRAERVLRGAQYHASIVCAPGGLVYHRLVSSRLVPIDQLPHLGLDARDPYWSRCVRRCTGNWFSVYWFCTKLLYEAIEEIDEAQVEAVTATGASGPQILSYRILPQMLPALAGITVFRWDINIREPTVLGLAGAGGIGLQLDASISTLA